MKATASGLLLASLLSCAAACKSPPAPAGPADAAPAPSAATGGAGRLTSPITLPGAVAPTLPNMPLGERFATEARSRPAGIKPSVEDVYKRLSATGLTIVDAKQHLAAPLAARFCVGARAVGGNNDTLLQISVCECATPEIARAARDWSEATLRSVVSSRTLYVNGQTLLVLREEKSTPDTDALVAKASDAFAKM